MAIVYQGIFLKRTAFSSNAQLFSFLTKEQGLLKSIYFKKGKHASPVVLQFFEVVVNNDSKFELPTIQLITPISSNEEIDISALELFVRYFVADVVYQTTAPKTNESEAYNFVELSKSRMKSNEALLMFPTWFLNGWIEVLGLLPICLPGASDLNIEQGEFVINHSFNPAAMAWNNMILEKKPSEKNGQKELLHLMLFYLNKHLPNLNVTKTLEIINQTLH